MSVVSRTDLTTAVEARLRATVTQPTTHGYITKPVDVPKLDDTGRVQRYWVLHPYGGLPTSEQDLGDTTVDLEWTFQVTCAAAFALDALGVAQAVDAALYRWKPDLLGLVCGPLRPPLGFDPGPVRIDRDVTPHRFWLPLQYRTTVTAT